MTELMRQLPKDLQREVWSFLGMESLGYTPSATAFIKFIDDAETYESPYKMIYGNEEKNGYYDVALGVPIDRPYPFISRRNFIIFHSFIPTQRSISLERFPKLNMKEVGLWYEGIHCDANCGCRLTSLEFPFRHHHNYKCDNCYGVDSGMIKDDEFVEHSCRECNELLTGAEWKKNREEETWYCFDCENIVNDSDEEYDD